MTTTSVTIGDLPAGSAGELLTLQRAAYVTEAQLHDELWLPALTQTLDELVEELSVSRCLGAWVGPRLVGSIRTREDGDVLRVSRLAVAPDLQGRGTGSRLLAAAEGNSSCRSAALFTGSLSEPNLRLYRRCGYVEQRREEIRPDLEVVHLAKALR